MNVIEQTEVKKAIDVLRKGGWIKFRGDLSDYICCDLSNSKAIMERKDEINRADVVVVADLESRLNYYLKEFPEQASVLFEFTQTPLTIIMDGVRNLPDCLTKNGKTAFRITNDELTSKLSEGIRRPLLCIPAEQSMKEADFTLPFSTSNFSKKDEKRIELTRGGVIRILSA